MIKELDYSSEVYFNRAEEFDIKEDKEIIEDLKDTLASMPDKLYLCANEIGVGKRAFAVNFSSGNIKVISNPVYQVREDFELVREKYLDKEYIIPRYKNITLCYQDEDGETKATKFDEDASPFMSQAMDCLDGLHASDYGLEVIPEFDEATDEERKEVVTMYIDSLKDLESRLDKDLTEDEDTKAVWKDFKFREALAAGEVELYKEPTPEKKFNRKERRFLDRFTKRMKKKGKTHEVS